jgi:hypothetical protein
MHYTLTKEEPYYIHPATGSRTGRVSAFAGLRESGRRPEVRAVQALDGAG